MVKEFITIEELKDPSEIKNIFIILKDDRAINIDTKKIAEILTNPLMKPALKMFLKA